MSIGGLDEIVKVINSKCDAGLDIMKWQDFDKLTKQQRKMLAKNARIRMARAHKEFMLERAAKRQPQHSPEYYEDMIKSVEKTTIKNNTTRIKEGVSQKQHLINIIRAAKHIDHGFSKVTEKICDDYIQCALKGVPKVETTTPDSIIFSNNPEMSQEERRLMRHFGKLKNQFEQHQGDISIYGHKYDPFSPTFGDDLFLALDTIVVNLSAAYDYAIENNLTDDLFNSPWWLACVDGATSNIAGVWLMIEAPNKAASFSEMVKEVSRGTLPLSALPRKNFKDIDDFKELVIVPVSTLCNPKMSFENFIKTFNKAEFFINNVPVLQNTELLSEISSKFQDIHSAKKPELL